MAAGQQGLLRLAARGSRWAPPRPAPPAPSPAGRPGTSCATATETLEIACAWRWPRRRNARAHARALGDAHAQDQLVGRQHRRRGAREELRRSARSRRAGDRDQLHHRVGRVERRHACPPRASALARLPPSVPRLRICGPPITAQACGSAGAQRATQRRVDHLACAWLPAPIQTWSSRSSMPFSSGHRGQVEERRPVAAAVLGLDQDVGAAGDRPHLARPLGQDLQRLVERARAEVAGRRGRQRRRRVWSEPAPARPRAPPPRRSSCSPCSGRGCRPGPRGSSSGAGVRVAVQQRLGRQHHARDADPALHAALLDERVLQRVQRGRPRPALDRLHARAVGLVGHHQAGVDGSGRPRARCRRRTRPCRSPPWRPVSRRSSRSTSSRRWSLRTRRRTGWPVDGERDVDRLSHAAASASGAHARSAAQTRSGVAGISSQAHAGRVVDGRGRPRARPR